MSSIKPGFFDYLLVLATMLVSVLGFWDIYFGRDADPQPHHHLHVATAFFWMGLMLAQLHQIGRGNFRTHKTLGLTVLIAGPLLVASTAMLSVHSAHSALAAGEGDFLIIQNIMGTIVLALLLVLGFMLKRNRRLHGALLLSTTVVFLGIALFFTLISFVPQFKIEGPETFYRFQTAAMTGQTICLAVGTFFFVRDFRTGWPFLLAALSFVLNEAIRASLTRFGLIDPLTQFVGSLSKPVTFVVTFVVLLLVLAAMTLPRRKSASERAG